MVAPTMIVRTKCDKLGFSELFEKLVYLWNGQSGTPVPTTIAVFFSLNNSRKLSKMATNML